MNTQHETQENAAKAADNSTVKTATNAEVNKGDTKVSTKEQMMSLIAGLPPKVIGEIKSTHFYETVKKLGEANAIAVIVLYSAIQNKNGEPQLSEIGKAVINTYLNEGATAVTIKSPMALSSYRVKRVKPFLNKKGLSPSDRAEMQDILYALACDEQSCQEGFKNLA